MPGYFKGQGRSAPMVGKVHQRIKPVQVTKQVEVEEGEPRFTIRMLQGSILPMRQAARARLNSPLNLTGTLEVATSGELTVGDRITADSINLTNNAVLTHPTTTGTSTFKVDIGAQTFIIDATSRIDVNGRGY